MYNNLIIYKEFGLIQIGENMGLFFEKFMFYTIKLIFIAIVAVAGVFAGKFLRHKKDQQKENNVQS